MKYNYRVETEVDGVKIQFTIVIRSRSVLGATTQAAALGKELHLLLVGPV